jgi:hypothetical protein
MISAARPLKSPERNPYGVRSAWKTH